MTSGANSGLLEYDPLMRFYRNFATVFIHVGGQLVGDYYNGRIVGRYVPGAADDEPAVQVDRFGRRTWFHSDERGSVIAGSNASGANSGIVTFDEYGKSGPGGSWRFAFTGQVHLINDLYDYKNRNYLGRLGRFGQPDPIGYAAGMNLYAYVGGDPVNFVDPLGLAPDNLPPIIITHRQNFDRVPLALAPRETDRNNRSNERKSAPPLECTSVNPSGCEATVTGTRPQPDLSGSLPTPQTAVVSPWSLLSGVTLAAERPARPDMCGSKSTPQVPDRISGVDLAPACARHDQCYGALGAQKVACDARFGAEVFAICFTSAHNLHCGAVAGVYFWGVTLGGHAAFREAQRAARGR